ncbi:hypothetical protein AO371_1650 [Moraxella catarrhalis]|nr:hypothetical protein AO371_1650 [Moraxella catarrhalis]
MIGQCPWCILSAVKLAQRHSRQALNNFDKIILTDLICGDAF